MSTKSESLMTKKKAQLVEIILRKDDVEAQLRKEIADSKLDLDKAKEIINKKECEIQNLLNVKVNNINHIKELEIKNEDLTVIAKNENNKILGLRDTITQLDEECNKLTAKSNWTFIAACVLAVAFALAIIF